MNCRNTDCFDSNGFPSISDGTVDLLIADLPYGVTSRNEWDKKIDLSKFFIQVERVCKKNAAVIMFCQGLFTGELMTGPWKKHFRYSLVWMKNKPRGFLNSNRMPLRYHEDILIFYRALPTYNPQMIETGKPSHACTRKNTGTNYGEVDEGVNTRAGETTRYPSSILQFPVMNAEQKPFHPTQKPVELMEWIIKTYSNENETICDPCAGSFSAAIACQNTNRKFIGFEMNKEYYDKAIIIIQAKE